MNQTALIFELLSFALTPFVLILAVSRLVKMTRRTDPMIRVALLFIGVGSFSYLTAPIFSAMRIPALLLFLIGTSLYLLCDRRGGSRECYGKK